MFWQPPSLHPIDQRENHGHKYRSGNHDKSLVQRHVFSILFHALSPYPFLRARYSDIIMAAKEEIEKHYMTEEISLNTVAMRVGMSPSYFSSIFSKEAGKTFVEHLTEVRMEKAREYLMCSAMKTSEIGYEVGYKDSHYFGYLFKKTVGCTPKEYRAGSRERL